MDREIFDTNARDPELLMSDLDVRDRKHKDTFSRLKFYLAWMDEMGRTWLLPDLEAYREQLLNETHLSATTARLHLTTIRARYRQFLERDRSEQLIAKLLMRFIDEEYIPEAVDVIRAHIYEAIDPKRSKVVSESQATGHVRLTNEEVVELLQKPGLDKPLGKRDTALIALMLATGLRVKEVSDLTIVDLRSETADGLAVQVRSATSDNTRYVPYGDMVWVLDLIELWFKQTKIKEGPVFRPYHVNSDWFRNAPISVRAIEMIFTGYPIHVNGVKTVITPMVLRRTYASRLYEEGIPLKKIQDYLAVGPSAVFDYIGDTTRKQTRTGIPNLYPFDSTSVSKAIKTGVLDVASTDSSMLGSDS